MWLVAVAAEEIRVFIRLEVRHAHDYFLRPERRGDHRHAFGNLGHVELHRRRIAGCPRRDRLLDFGRLGVEFEHRLGMHADIAGNDELQPRETDTFVGQPAESESELGIADVHHDLGRRRRHLVERNVDGLDLE